jgi:hypothetical protein
MRSRLVPGLFLLLALALPAFAAGSGGTSLDRILPEIRRNTPGTFYDAQGPFFGPDGQARYRIKWMTPDGRIVWFDADARSGRVLGPAGGENGGARGGMTNGGNGRDRSQDRSSSGRQHFRNDEDSSGRDGNPGWPGSQGGAGNRGRGGSRGDGGGHDGGRGDSGGHDGGRGNSGGHDGGRGGHSRHGGD